MIVTRIEDQGDRVLLYSKRADYHVIASTGCTVRVGDQIDYEPYGWNFGWLIRLADGVRARETA
jgi:hypothetical protein